MTAKTPQFPLHYVEDKPQTGFDYVSKGTVARVDPDPHAEHLALLTICELPISIAEMAEYVRELGMAHHTCERCDNRRNA